MAEHEAAVTACTQPAAGSSGIPIPDEDPFPYRNWPCQTGTLDTPAGPVPRLSGRLTLADRLGHWQMRWGIGRLRYRVAPGLYALGNPSLHSPVLVTANYKMTVDVLRRDTDGTDAWLLVLDTRGINVWCAAGKGTFGTAEVLRRVAVSRLGEVVNHRTLILPQLGAPGVAAHEVLRGCGFRVVYGPVRARDLPAFLAAGMQASPAMRRVTFTAAERLALTPVEIIGMLRVIPRAALLLLVLGGIGPQLFSVAAAIDRGGAAILAGLAGLVTGAVLVPMLLPWLPGRMFACKGGVAGLAVALAGLALFGGRLGGLDGGALLLTLPAVAAWCAMNFTGSTPFTSPSGVEREMRRTIPLQAAALLAGGALWLAGGFLA